jgi:EAL domain-containing protein (putative c-di-GMP-specific phosphodiesterase class I)
MDDFNRIKGIMEEIAEQGYRFFLDDFGMGYSNFNCLLKLPFTTVKLDRSLTSTVLSNKNEQNIVYMLTELFHRMDLKVVAEGAETEDQVNVLKEFGVDRIQGYYYAKPMDIKKIIAFYDKYPVDRYY